MKVRIIGGGFGHRPGPEGPTEFIPRGGVVDVSDSVAKRIIAQGIAEAVIGEVDCETAEPQEAIELVEVECVSLDSMTLSQLKAYAKGNGIALGNATSKSAVLKAIKAAEDTQEAEAPDLSTDGMIV